MISVPTEEPTFHLKIFVILFNHNSVLHTETTALSESIQKEKNVKKENLEFVILVFLPQHRSRYFVFSTILLPGLFIERKEH